MHRRVFILEMKKIERKKLLIFKQLLNHNFSYFYFLFYTTQNKNNEVFNKIKIFYKSYYLPIR